jgi:hypothetical protein
MVSAIGQEATPPVLALTPSPFAESNVRLVESVWRRKTKGFILFVSLFFSSWFWSCEKQQLSKLEKGRPERVSGC